MSTNRRLARHQPWAKPFFAFVLLMIYLNLPLNIGGTAVNGVLLSIVVLVLYILCPSGVRQIDVNFALLFPLLLGVSVWFSPGGDILVEKIKGAFQFYIAIAVFVIIVRNQLLGTRALLVLFQGAMFVIVLGALAEQLIPYLKEISNAFGDWVYPDWYLYNDIWGRDSRLTGFSVTRPKLFTSEPSNVVKMFIILSSCLLVLKPTEKTLAFCLVSTTLMLVIFASPILFIGLVMYAFIWLRISKNRLTGSLRLFVLFLGGLGFLGLIFLVGIDRVLDRFANVGDPSVISSENMRLFFPILGIIDTLQAFPLSGIGIGGRENLIGLSSYGFLPQWMLGSNSIADFILFFGLFGIFVGFFIYRYIRAVVGKGSFLHFCVLAGMFSFSTGGVETIYFWSSIGLVALVLRVRQENEFKESRYSYSG